MEDIPGYSIHKKIGSGGMSTVYLATQESFDRKVALKVMLPTFSANKDFVKRFSREAKIVAGLSHPHIIPVYDVGQVNELCYMSMDYLTGYDLSHHIQEGMTQAAVLEVIEQIASALHYAHSKGYIHRDIKPENIMVMSDNTVKLMDFGLACHFKDSGANGNNVQGTPYYMSPEQARGLKNLDARSDIWALGVGNCRDLWALQNVF